MESQWIKLHLHRRVSFTNKTLKAGDDNLEEILNKDIMRKVDIHDDPVQKTCFFCTI